MNTITMKKHTVLRAAEVIGTLLLLSALAIGLRCAAFLPRFLH